MIRNRIIPIPMGALPNSYAVGINMSLDEDYILSAQLVDQNGNTMGTAQTVDLPLESVIVNGRYDNNTQSLILVLDNGNEITIPIGGIVSGLQEEITAQNPLSADLLTDGTNNKVFTSVEQTKLSGIESGAEVNVQSNWNESNSSSDSYIQNKPDLSVYAQLAEDNTFTGDNTFGHLNILQNADFEGDYTISYLSCEEFNIGFKGQDDNGTSNSIGMFVGEPEIENEFEYSAPELWVSKDTHEEDGEAMTDTTEEVVVRPTEIVFHTMTYEDDGQGGEPVETDTQHVVINQEGIEIGGNSVVTEDQLATVATTGDYEDLSNKPTIPIVDITAAGNNTFTGDNTFTGITNFTKTEGYDPVVSITGPEGSTGLYGGIGYISHENGNNINYDGQSGTLSLYGYYGEYGMTLDPENRQIQIGSNYVVTDDQLATVATTGDYEDLSNKPTIPTTTSELTNDSGYITGIDSSDVVSALGYTPGTSNFSGSYNDLSNKPDLSIYAQSANLSTVATSGSYNDLSNKPTIPTVNDATITLTQGGTTKGTFTLNQNTNSTIDFGEGLTSVDWSDVNNKPNFATVATSGSYNDLSNKPDLSIYAQSANLSTVATSGSYNDLSNKPTIPTVPTNVSAFTNDANYATESYVNTAISNIPSPMIFKGSLGTGGTITTLPAASSANEGFTYKVITDGTYASQSAKVGDIFISNGSAWILIPSGDEPSGTVSSVGITVPTGLTVSGSPITSSGTIAISLDNGYSIPTTTKQAQWDAKSDFSGSYNDLTNKPDLSVYAQSANLATVATSGSYNDLSNKPTIPTVNDATISITDSNGTALGSFTTNDNTNQTIVVPAAQIQSDWNQSNSSAVDYIKNKPDLSVYAQSANLATVATSGSYNDLSNKPTIPAAQVNSDWNSNSGVSQILNKPTLATVATSGSYNDLSNTPTIPVVDVTAAGDNTFTGTNTFDEGASICITNPDVSPNILALTSDNIILYNDDAQTEITPNYITLNDVSYGMGELYPNSISFFTPNGNQLNISISEEDDGQGNITGETYFESQFDINITSDNNINLNGDVVITTNNGTATIDGNNIITDNQLASVATSGSYNDLTNLPTIPAAQVNSDWNASSGVSQILNKPTLATVATSGSYNDLSNLPTIPTAMSQLTNDSGYITGIDSSDVIGALGYTPGTSNFSGSYNDLTNKPTIPAAQVNSDWNASSGVSQILNKPTLASVATSGSYNDLSNKPTIPAAQVNSDWDASSGVAQILNKPTLATVATSGSYNDLSNKPTIPAAQVQADWAETDSTDMSYIANKPSTITMEVVFTDQTTGTYNLYFEPTV